MKTQTLLGHPDKFTSSEFTVLISMVLGFSCEDTRKLLGLKHDKYESVCQVLFEKLGASNHYTGVKKAYHFRNPLESVRTMGQVEKIVDENVKKAVLKVLKKANLSDSNTFVPQQVFLGPMPMVQKRQKFS